MGLVDGQVVVVTGAAGGIGRAIAIDLARQGATVVAADRDAGGLEETRSVSPAVLEVAPVDVSQADQVQRLVDGAAERHGRLTAIVNNAGISIPNDVATATVEELDRTLAVNVRGPFLGCKYAVPHLLRNGGGSIVNVGSINSVAAEPQLTTYCASKGAVLMLTKSVALDYATRRIRCNCVCPGFVDTAINLPHAQRLESLQLDEDLSSFQPIGRPIETQEIAGAVTFLVSDASTAVTGTAVMVDGGVTAKA